MCDHYYSPDFIELEMLIGFGEIPGEEEAETIRLLREAEWRREELDQDRELLSEETGHEEIDK